jgi:hypothetical protein
MYFVFGSNLRGIHGAGAADFALKHRGAVWGHGVGIMGQSYALPTKDTRVITLPIEDVKRHVNDFIQYAKDHEFMTFQVTRIGCGLAGFKDKDIAPMFEHAPDNCAFDSKWQPWLPGRRYWGTN